MTKDKLEVPSPGQIDYEADVARRPTYHDGTPRRQWAELGTVERWSWERRAQVDSKGTEGA